MGIQRSRETSWPISASGKIAPSASGRTGRPSGPSGGAGGFGMSAMTLYQWVGISDSARRILVSLMTVSRLSGGRGKRPVYPLLRDNRVGGRAGGEEGVPTSFTAAGRCRRAPPGVALPRGRRAGARFGKNLAQFLGSRAGSGAAFAFAPACQGDGSAEPDSFRDRGVRADPRVPPGGGVPQHAPHARADGRMGRPVRRAAARARSAAGGGRRERGAAAAGARRARPPARPGTGRRRAARLDAGTAELRLSALAEPRSVPQHLEAQVAEPGVGAVVLQHDVPLGLGGKTRIGGEL